MKKVSLSAIKVSIKSVELSEAAIREVACGAIRDAMGFEDDWRLDDGDSIISKKSIIGFPHDQIETKRVRTANKDEQAAFILMEKIQKFFKDKP